ncbi:hypothetical protein HN51_045027, partial [Arachis hypogaea]
WNDYQPTIEQYRNWTTFDARRRLDDLSPDGIHNWGAVHEKWISRWTNGSACFLTGQHVDNYQQFDQYMNWYIDTFGDHLRLSERAPQQLVHQEQPPQPMVNQSPRTQQPPQHIQPSYPPQYAYSPYTYPSSQQQLYQPLYSYHHNSIPTVLRGMCKTFRTTIYTIIPIIHTRSCTTFYRAFRTAIRPTIHHVRRIYNDTATLIFIVTITRHIIDWVHGPESSQWVNDLLSTPDPIPHALSYSWIMSLDARHLPQSYFEHSRSSTSIDSVRSVHRGLGCCNTQTRISMPGGDEEDNEDAIDETPIGDDAVADTLPGEDEVDQFGPSNDVVCASCLGDDVGDETNLGYDLRVDPVRKSRSRWSSSLIKKR